MLRVAWKQCHPLHVPRIVNRTFAISTTSYEKALPPRRILDEQEITESFLKGSGPGGQKINKTSSAVQLKHLPTGIVVKCQGTRSREQNRKDARRMLAERLDEMEKGEESRIAIKTERARAKKASSAKKSRRKYKMLDDQKAADGSGMRDVDEAVSSITDGVDTRNGVSSAEGDADDLRNKK